MVIISNPAGRGSKDDEDMGSKTPNEEIALVCDRILQYITLSQANQLHQSHRRASVLPAELLMKLELSHKARESRVISKFTLGHKNVHEKTS
jgi:hypothetical protein